MRKYFVLLLLVSLLVAPSVVQAQGDVRFGNLTVQLWPEYDHPDMLVMYSFTMAADSALPADVQIRIPADADMNAVAKLEGDGMVNVPYDAPVKEGEWVVITITVDDLSDYRVEYYAPLQKSGDTRNYDFYWQNDYAVDALFVQFQQPPNASNTSTTPLLPNIGDAGGGIQYHELEAGDLAAGKEFSLNLSYDKPDDALTVSSMPVEVGGGTAEPVTNNASSGFSVETALPMVLVGIGLLLIAGGLAYFFIAGRRETEPQQRRKRHAPSTASAGGNVYCHECGSRASSGDKFCRSCGAKLRQ